MTSKVNAPTSYASVGSRVLFRSSEDVTLLEFASPIDREYMRRRRKFLRSKMAMFMFFDDRLHREVCRNRVFRDRTHALEVWNEDEITRTFRFPQEKVLRLRNELIENIECGLPRRGTDARFASPCP